MDARGWTGDGGEDVGLALDGRSPDVPWGLITLWPLPAPNFSSTFEIRWASGTPVLSKRSIKVSLGRGDFGAKDGDNLILLLRGELSSTVENSDDLRERL